jgi:hypothetical protein
MDMFIGGNNTFLIVNFVVKEDLIRKCFYVLENFVFSHFLI